MKKLKFLLALVLIVTGLSTALLSATPSEHHISGFSGGDHYHVQDTSYSCGPASIQMVLDWLGAQPLPTQSELATELNMSVGGYAFIEMMPVPFQSRGYDVEARQGLGIDELKENIASDHPVIILMYLDNGSAYGHYVVVVGFNVGGVFVHDSYSTAYGEVSRDVGPNVFISNDLLAELWLYSPGHWGLIIESSPSSEWPIETVVELVVVILAASVVAIILKKKA
jgi:hypothetical protein